MISAHEHAQQYAQIGWRTAPVPAGLKHPGVNDWQTRGTTDQAAIDTWYTGPTRTWGEYDQDTLGVCVLTGQQSNIWVLDIDPGHGGDDTLADLEHEHGQLPDTVECLTGGGGRHLYFVWPADCEIRNDQAGKLGPGLDVRGTGGQVVAPPTIHPGTGQRYEWEASGDPTEGVPPTQAPGWLIELLTAETEQAPRRTQTNSGATRLGELMPGERFEAETEWADLLTGDRWTMHSARNGRSGYYELWTRPGKDPRQGASASLGYADGDVLKLFTPNAPHLSDGATYTRFGYYAATRHNGDHGAAATALAAKYRPVPVPTPPTPLPTGATGLPVVSAAPVVMPFVLEPVSQTAAEWANTAPTMIGDARTRPPFPTDVFPEWIRANIEQTADELQIADDLPSMLAITALSLVAAGRIDIQISGPWREPLNTYLVSALPPGAGKSPAFSMMLNKPLDDYEAELQALSAREEIRVKDLRDVLENEMTAAKKQGDMALVHEIRGRLEENPPVVAPRLMVEDITPEKLAVKLFEQNGRIALVSTEGGLFGMMTGRYSDASNLDVYLQAWSRDTIRQDRIGRPDMVVRNPTLTVGLTVQPSVVRRLADHPDLQGRGLTARFMFSVPRDTVGRRDFERVTTWDDAIESMYARNLVGIAHQCQRDWAEHDERPVPIRFTDEARAMFMAWRQDHEVRCGPDGDLRYMTEWVTKLQSTTARLAGLLHLADHNAPHVPLSEVTMGKAIRVGDYWEAHARIAHDLWGSDPTEAAAMTVLRWLHRQGVSEASASEIQQGCKGTFKRVDQVREPLEFLVELGWLRPLFEGPLVLGRRGSVSPRFAIHGDIHSLDGVIHKLDSAESGGSVTGRDNPGLTTLRPGDVTESEMSRRVAAISPTAPKTGTYPQAVQTISIISLRDESESSPSLSTDPRMCGGPADDPNELNLLRTTTIPPTELSTGTTEPPEQLTITTPDDIGAFGV